MKLPCLAAVLLQLTRAQPLLPASVQLTVLEEDTRTFSRAQLVRQGHHNTSADQADWGYFEGDIVGVSVEWNNGRVG